MYEIIDNMGYIHGPELESCISETKVYSPCPSENGGENMGAKYRQRVIIGTDGNGKDLVQWACGNTQQEFQRAVVNIYNANRLSERAEEPPKAKGIAFDTYATEWFETFKRPKLKPKTATSRESFFKKHITGGFGNRPIDSITSKDVQALLNAKVGYSRDYIRDIMNYMNGIFKAAVEDGIIQKNPMDSRLIFNPSKKVNKRRALTKAEKADIVANIPRLDKRNDRMFMAFLMFTGMRPGEIYALRWEDIDTECGLIHIRRGSSFDKGKILIGDTNTEAGIRDIPLDRRLVEFLLPLGSEGYILQRDGSHSGEPYSEQTHKRAWERIQRTIDVHGMIPYEGRHTYLTEMCEAGIDMKTMQTIAGHADERMLMRTYVHARPENVVAAGKMMDAYFDVITGNM